MAGREEAARLYQAFVKTVRGSLRGRVGRELSGLTETDPGEDHERMLREGVIAVAAAKENAGKNRYSNIFPLDAHRVVLATAAEGSGTDYVNATHVRLPALGGERIIAAQAPMHPDFHGPNTCGDFWRAVWENRVGLVVGLARVQSGFSGSAPYWPTAGTPGGTVSFGGFEIRLLSEELVSHDIVRRQLLVAKVSGSEPARSVIHLHYQNWPNYGIPESTASSRQILRLLEKHQAEHAAEDPCVLVHCSGGVGRTGVFLAAYQAIKSVLPLAALPDTPASEEFAPSMKAEVAAGGGHKPGAGGAPVPAAALTLAPVFGTAEPAPPPEDLAIVDAVRVMRHTRHPWMVEGAHQLLFAYAVALDEIEDRASRLAK